MLKMRYGTPETLEDLPVSRSSSVGGLCWAFCQAMHSQLDPECKRYATPSTRRNVHQ